MLKYKSYESEPRSKLWKLGKYLAYLFIIGNLLLGSPNLSIAFEIATSSRVPSGSKWSRDKMPVVYYINENGSDDITDGSDFEAIHKAFKTWEDVFSSYITFKYGGTTTARSGRRDGQNIVSWIEKGWPSIHSGAGAASLLWYGPDDKIEECDIIFNGEDYHWITNGNDASPPYDIYDIQAQATHEIGHLLGLTESPFGSALRSTSSPTLTSMRMLNDDDIAGVTFLYPRHILKGVVRDALTGSPLSDASVEKVGNYYTVKTDSEGRYKYGMPGGVAYILAYCDGYVPSLEPVEVTQDSVTVYDISLSPIPPEGPITSVEDVLSGIPRGYLLAQNYPNPFNPETTIQFTLPDEHRVRLTIYNTSGQRIATLLDEQMPKGRHSVVWNGKDATGKDVASGVYFYHLTAGDFTATRKMLLIR